LTVTKCRHDAKHGPRELSAFTQTGCVFAKRDKTPQKGSVTVLVNSDIRGVLIGLIIVIVILQQPWPVTTCGSRTPCCPIVQLQKSAETSYAEVVSYVSPIFVRFGP
jgi:hypothetical protein